jgi:hypothetical protein
MFIVIGYLMTLLSLQISSVGLISANQTILHSATLLSQTNWSDDFNDGNFDDWTVTRGEFSVSSNTLKGVTSTWNHIEHNSTTTVGTWSFDYNMYGGPDGIWQEADGGLVIWLIANGHHSVDPSQGASGYFIYFHPHDDAIELWMDPGDDGYNRVLIGSWSPPDFIKWWHVDVTRDSEGLFTVYLDGVSRIQGTDTTYNTSVFFGFLGYNQQEMDNVDVQDVVVPPPTATTSPTTTSPTDTITPTATGQGILDYLLRNPVLLAAIITAVATVCAAAIKKSRD